MAPAVILGIISAIKAAADNAKQSLDSAKQDTSNGVQANSSQVNWSNTAENIAKGTIKDTVKENNINENTVKENNIQKETTPNE